MKETPPPEGDGAGAGASAGACVDLTHNSDENQLFFILFFFNLTINCNCTHSQNQFHYMTKKDPITGSLDSKHPMPDFFLNPQNIGKLISDIRSLDNLKLRPH